MIKKIDITQQKSAEQVLAIQMPAYRVEAELIGFDDLPPLRDTVVSLQACGETFWGNWIGEELAGAISYKREDEVLDIHRLIVSPDHFRKGIAGQLLTHAIENEPETKKVIVTTGAKNTPAKQLYKRFGFQELRDVEVAPGLSLTFFEKLLS
ncbi:MAG: GNAT family N-acetyltransferase [Clostridia bacterium]